MEGNDMITLDNIKEAIDRLNNIWMEPGPNGRKRWQNRDIWQSCIPDKEMMSGILPIINGLENVSEMTVLDLGCDVGIWSVVLSQKFKKVIALDMDETSIERTEQTLNVFWDMGFDISNIFVEHNTFEQTYKHNFNDIDALFSIDSWYIGIDELNMCEDLFNHLKLLIKSEKENFTIDLNEKLKGINSVKNKMEEYNFKVSDYYSCDYLRHGDIIIGRK
jgi:SAM-dependent methyltransferase